LPAFREDIVKVAPFLRGSVGELNDWKEVSLLAVAVDHLRDWSRPGLLCIGDSAHAMSPVGGVGINLAIQDAVAAANILAESLQGGPVPEARLRRSATPRVSDARDPGIPGSRAQTAAWPRLEQARPNSTASVSPEAVAMVPVLRRIPARLVGIGVRPEHVRTPGT